MPFPWPPLRRALEQMLLDHELDGELSVAIVDDATIARLHSRYAGEPNATDVISFSLAEADEPAGGPPRLLGEVIASAETALREARRRGVAAERELALYVLHGALHLAGYDDVEPRRKQAMRRAERRYLKLLG